MPIICVYSSAPRPIAWLKLKRLKAHVGSWCIKTWEMSMPIYVWYGKECSLHENWCYFKLVTSEQFVWYMLMIEVFV